MERSVTAADRIRQAANVLMALYQAAAPAYVARLGTDQFTQPFAGGDPPVIPASYAFAIWGPIYLGAMSYSVWQALPRNAARPLLRRVGWWTALAFAATGSWVLVAQRPERVWITVVLLGLLTGALGLALREVARAGSATDVVSRADRWLVVAPLSVFAGWGSVAVFANTAAALRQSGVTAPGSTETAIGLVMIALASAGAAVATRAMNGNRWYAGTILWALTGIALGSVNGARRPANPVVASAALLGCALVTAAAVVGGRRAAATSARSGASRG